MLDVAKKMDTGLLLFLGLGAFAVLAVLYNISQMCSAALSPDGNDEPPIPAVAQPVCTKCMPRVNSRQKVLLAAEASISDMEDGTGARLTKPDNSVVRGPGADAVRAALRGNRPKPPKSRRAETTQDQQSSAPLMALPSPPTSPKSPPSSLKTEAPRRKYKM